MTKDNIKEFISDYREYCDLYKRYLNEPVKIDSKFPYDKFRRLANKFQGTSVDLILLEAVEIAVDALQFASIENVSCREALFNCKQALTKISEKLNKG